MARTVAAKRPGGDDYTPKEAVAFLEKWFPRDRAIRIVAIAKKYTVKAEALPKGVVTLKLTNAGRFIIEVNE